MHFSVSGSSLPGLFFLFIPFDLHPYIYPHLLKSWIRLLRLLPSSHSASLSFSFIYSLSLHSPHLSSPQTTYDQPLTQLPSQSNDKEMSATSTVRSGFNIVRHVVPASTPSFKLACNTYRRATPLPPPSSSVTSTTPPIIFTHANGFHKEIWEPVISRLSPPWANSDMYAFDCRNQGDSAVLNKDVLEKHCRL